MEQKREPNLERREYENNLVAAGSVYMALGQAAKGDLDPQIVTDSLDTATNQIDIKVPYMKSRYRLTVERIPDLEDTP